MDYFLGKENKTKKNKISIHAPNLNFDELMNYNPPPKTVKNTDAVNHEGRTINTNYLETGYFYYNELLSNYQTLNRNNGGFPSSLAKNYNDDNLSEFNKKRELLRYI